MYSLAFVIGNGDGSPEFMRQAAAWKKYHEKQRRVVKVIKLAIADRPLDARYASVAAALKANANPVDCLEQVAFFCHGWSSGIQVVPGNKIKKFAKAIEEYVGNEILLTLYCCTTGSDTDPKTSEMKDTGKPGGDGGFADLLRDALCAEGITNCQVDAHTTAGHTTKNPYVRRFEGHDLSTGGVGGQWIVSPNSKQWRKWKVTLDTGLRFEFPFMSFYSIHTYLDK